jgi:adenosylcobinamide kinase / adenosylcobinamide-phosphate guanylyltransferase
MDPGIRKATLILVTGGARSGKSRFAQDTALSLSQNPVYVATAKRYNDQEFQHRINRHIADRDERWTTIEEQVKISSLKLEEKVVVIDCVTLWLTNFFSLYKCEVEPSLNAIKAEIESLLNTHATFIVITNELGMGVHAETETGRKFTDLQGWTNQFIASKANKVVFMVSGIPLTIKNET